MNALTSYLRHLIVTGILLLVEKFKLPIEGADQAADIIALALIGTLSWVFVKYVAPFLKVPKGSGLALFALAASLALLTPSCSITIDPVTGRPKAELDLVEVAREANKLRGEIHSAK